MNRKQFILVLLALCVIGGAGLALFLRNQKTWNVHEAKIGELLFPNFDPNAVAAIHVKAHQDFRIVRTNGTWRVPERWDYPANFGQISDLLLEIKRLKVMESEIIGPSMRGRVYLDEPGSGPTGGHLLEFEDEHGKVIASLLLGLKHDRKQKENEPLGMHGWFDGRYCLLPSEPNNVLLVPTEFPGAATYPGGWVDKTFFKIENPKFVGLVSSDPKKNWELIRETPNSKWTMNGLNPNETLDRGHLAQATEIWQFPTFIDVGSNVPPSETLMEKPDVVTVMTFDNVAYTFKIGRPRDDGSRFMTMSVAADFSAPRIPSPDETPEDKKRLDDEFEAKKKVLKEKVAKDRTYTPYVYLTEDWLNVVLCTRDQLVQAADSSSTKEASLK